MARYAFGGHIEDFMFSVGGGMMRVPALGTAVTFWTAQTGGTLITDLTDMSSNPITSVTMNASGFLPQFQGPDTGGTFGTNATQMWADGGNGYRLLMSNADAAAQAAAASAAAMVTANDAAVYTAVTGGATTKPALDAAYARTRGEVTLPFPTANAVVDDANVSAAITAAGSNGLIRASMSPLGLEYQISTRHVAPDGVDIQGLGGGSTSRTARTIFKCTTAVAAIAIYGGGGETGGFCVDGNSTANTPFERQGGTGANARTFKNITVKNNTGASKDLALFYGAQNDIWIQCGFAGAVRDIAVFDQGYGGAHFIRCEWTGNAGRYYHRFDNQVGGGVYAVPTDITFTKGIMEQGATVTSLVQLNKGAIITYSDYAFVVSTAASAELISVASGVNGIALHNPYFQSTAVTTPVSGTTAIKVYGTGDITITGRAWYLNLDAALACDGVSSFIYDQSHASFFNCNTAFVGTGSASYLQVANLVNGIRQLAYASGTVVAVHYNAARTAFQYEKDANGDERLFPGTGFGSPDIIVGRVAAGAWGSKTAQGVLVTGSGTTAQRPAAATALKGAAYFNTDVNLFQGCDGTGWDDATTHTWIAPTVSGVTTNGTLSGSVIGYTKIGGIVHLRGVGGTVTVGTIFTLPAGFRPAATQYFPVATFTGGGVLTAGYISVTSAGVVAFGAGAGADVSFDSICFTAEN